MGQDKLQKFTNTWIIGSLVYFAHGAKRDKMVIKSKQRRLMSLTLFEEIAMSYSGESDTMLQMCRESRQKALMLYHRMELN